MRRTLVPLLIVVVLLACCAAGCRQVQLPDDREGLIKAMADDDMQTQAEAGRKYERVFGLSGLLQAASHEHPRVRRRALILLANHPTDEVREAGRAAVQDPNPR